jgi:hypothetical protein
MNPVAWLFGTEGQIAGISLPSAALTLRQPVRGKRQDVAGGLQREYSAARLALMFPFKLDEPKLICAGRDSTEATQANAIDGAIWITAFCELLDHSGPP